MLNNGRCRLNSTLVTLVRQEASRDPKQVIYMSVEGMKTEKLYFTCLNLCLSEEQKAPIIRIEVLEQNDDGSDPNHILGLIQEYIDLRREGVVPKRIKNELNTKGVTEKDVDDYVEDSSVLGKEKRDVIKKVFDSWSVDLIYRKYLSRIKSHSNDRFIMMMDRDGDSHKKEHIIECIAYAKENKIEMYLSNPCFEMWLLLHSDDGYKELSHMTEDSLELEDSKKCRDKLSSLVGKLMHHRKNGIKEGIFRVRYWENITKAIENANRFYKPVDKLLDETGTNISDFFTDDIMALLPKQVQCAE